MKQRSDNIWLHHSEAISERTSMPQVVRDTIDIVVEILSEHVDPGKIRVDPYDRKGHWGIHLGRPISDTWVCHIFKGMGISFPGVTQRSLKYPEEVLEYSNKLIEILKSRL